MLHTEKLFFKFLIFSVLMNLLFLQKSFSQEYKIYFDEIKPIIIKKDIFGNPSFVKYQASWNLFRITHSRATRIHADEITSEEYKLHFLVGQKDTIIQISNRIWVSDTLEAQKEYALRFDTSFVVLRDGSRVTATPADKQWVTFLTGKKTKIRKVKSEEVEFSNLKAFFWLISPYPIDLIFKGRRLTEEDKLIQAEEKYSLLFSIKKSYDTATYIGQIAFGIIKWCLALGMLGILSCHRRLRLSHIFPYKSVVKLSNIFPYRKGKHLFFELQIPILSFFVDFFSGLTLKRVPGFEVSYSKRKEQDYDRIESDWNELIECISLTDDQIYQLSDEELGKKQRELWRTEGSQEYNTLEVRLKNLGDYPIVNIILAGLRNLKISRISLHKTSEEVERAMENSASAELENLKQRSYFEWLWNLGALAPLAGLLGTVTGISFSFLKIGSSPGGAEEVIEKLAPHINEALYTTILGLIVGIFLMFSFYYYKSKLDWIYAKWEEIYVNLTEKL